MRLRTVPFFSYRQRDIESFAYLESSPLKSTHIALTTSRQASRNTGSTRQSSPASVTFKSVSNYTSERARAHSSFAIVAYFVYLLNKHNDPQLTDR
jgi:hypothetical protein